MGGPYIAVLHKLNRRLSIAKIARSQVSHNVASKLLQYMKNFNFLFKRRCGAWDI